MCKWQGYGFGAAYEDACCIDGKLWDLDSCGTAGEPLAHGGDEDCPQCLRKMEGMGPMAALRERSLRDMEQLADDLASGELDETERTEAAAELKSILVAATLHIHRLEGAKAVRVQEGAGVNRP